MKKLFLFCISILLIGCGGNSMDNHIGYWQPIESKHQKVSEISKKDNNYFLSENILQKTGFDIFGKENKPSKPILLQNNNEKLSIMGIQPIALSSDNNELFIGDKTYKRITKQQFDEIQLKVETEFNEIEKVKQACKKAREKFTNDSAEIKTKYKDDFKMRLQKTNEVMEAFSLEMKKCRLIG
jgi:hypothetical protein